jgi:predicted dienelactone hydrolase
VRTRSEAACPHDGAVEPSAKEAAGTARKVEELIGAIQGLIPELLDAVRESQRSPEQRSVLAAARQVQEDRRRRAALFGQGLFVEPAWDLLVELFVAGLEARPVSVSSACIGSFAPSSTALRHIAHLEQLGFVAKKPHPSDSRSKYIELTEAGAARMTQFFSGRPANQDNLRA